MMKTIEAKDFIKLANQKGIQLDNVVLDWGYKALSLIDWINLTITTYKDVNNNLRDEVDIVNHNLIDIILPSYEWLCGIYQDMLTDYILIETKKIRKGGK